MIRAALLLSWVLGYAPPPARAHAAVVSCLAADETSAAILGYVRDLLTSTAPGDVTSRQTYGLNNISPSQVVLVTNTTDCAKAAAAIDKAGGIATSGRSVYLIKAGNKRYFAQDPTLVAGEYRPLYLMDSKFVVLTSFLSF